ncbi:hypothetical protein [Nakamurella aerolata]|uniref:Uncharacterized protein n=1 Tax=Nakamurella aerolata TaxID=1656892 RepID=A0A849ACZ7_9ACTN|nr:hypothetical protein [Nakamurella aerolata]NNG37048.1 hypothetical protein [Nakamurella aerolata]
MLLLAVTAGIVGMHVLSTGGQPGHGAMTMPASMTMPAPIATPVVASGPSEAPAAQHRQGAAIGATGEPAYPMPAQAAAQPTGELSDPAAPTPDHAAMTACVLFLVVGGTLLLLALALRSAPATGSPLRRVRWIRRNRRGPPGTALHLRLGVIRV